MSDQEKLLLIEEMMDLDAGELRMDSLLADYEEWDSLTKLMLIAEAKKTFGLILTTEIIQRFVTVRDVCDYLG